LLDNGVGGGKKSRQHLEISVEQKRETAMILTEEYPISLVCEVLELPRSSYYYTKLEKQETEIKKDIERLAGNWPVYGYRRITEHLKREGYLINSKRVRRLMGEMRLLQHQKERKTPPTTTNSNHPYPRYPNLVKDLKIVRPDQVWVSDITYIRLPKGFVYLAILMDVYTRSLRGWHLGRGLDQSLTINALEMALHQGRSPEIHHSDQGGQYAAYNYVDLLKEVGTKISMAEAEEANQNPYAERVIRTIKEEEVYLSDYQDYYDAYQQIGQFIEDVYQHKRIHSSLGYLTPAEFEAEWFEIHDEVTVVH